MVRRFMRYREIPASGAAVCRKGGIDYDTSLGMNTSTSFVPSPKGCGEAASLENRQS